MTWEDRNHITALMESIASSLEKIARPRRFGRCSGCEFWRRFGTAPEIKSKRFCVRSADSRTNGDPTELQLIGIDGSCGCGEFEPRMTPDDEAAS